MRSRLTTPPTRRNISMTPAANTQLIAYIRFDIVNVRFFIVSVRLSSEGREGRSEAPELISEASGWVMMLLK